jgi:predicted peptidase
MCFVRTVRLAIIFCGLLTACCLQLAATGQPAEDLPRQPFIDCTYLSKVFGEQRHYRLFLPPDYNRSHQAYPVIYYFHGHSDRYTLEKYDDGKDTVP